jgi:putative transposase
MARSVRIEYADAYYHVMARGNRRGAIFLDDDDRRFFLQTLSEACGRTGWRVHAWVLMGNHYHLFLETPEGNLVEGMKWLQNTYTRRFNIRHGNWGRLFGDRYKAVLVEGKQAAYYETLTDYIHLNPVRAGRIKPKQGASLRDYPWSSVAAGYALPPGRRPKWLAAETGLSVFGLRDTAAGRRAMVERLDRRALEEGSRSGLVSLPAEVDRRTSHLRRGWYWGSQEFARRMLRLGEKMITKGTSRAYGRSSQRLAYHQQQAEQWLQEGLRVAGLKKKDLAALKGNDPRKVALAALLWEKTTVSQTWIASRLQMGSAANVSQVLRRAKQPKYRKTLSPVLCEFIDHRRTNH